MEVMRNNKPKEDFLKKIRKICNEKKIILIFDECTSGYREIMGGIHLKFNVNPDIVLYGKSLGNGYPITAMVGREDIMNYCNKTFLSSTFWSERIGYVAGCKTLEVMEKNKLLGICYKAWKRD